MIKEIMESLAGMNGLHLAVVVIVFLGGMALASLGLVKHR